MVVRKTGVRGVRAAAVAGACGLLAAIAGCTNSKFGNDNVVFGIDTSDYVRNVDLSPRAPRGNGQSPDLLSRQQQGGQGRNLVFAGGNPSSASPDRPLFAPSTDGKAYDLNLEDVDIATAARIIFGDIMKTGYSVSPAVKGTVSLSTGRPIPVDHLVAYFESALSFSNAAITKDALGYKIVPLSTATLSASVDSGGRRSVSPGYGVSVVPLYHVSADSIIPLIDNFITRQGLVKVDKDRNALMFQGTSAERRAAIEAVLSFDQEWLSSQAVGIYRVQTTNPQIMIREVEEILHSKEGGRAAGLVQMVPVERLNGVLVVAKSNSMLRQTFSWLERMDRNDLNSVGIRVYQVQYADAAQLASTLNAMFLGGAPAAVDATAQSQFPPDSATGQGVTNGATEQAKAAPVVATSSGNALLENVRISADPTNNTILIYANNEKYKIIERAIASLDRRPLQVAIETTIAEITLNNNLSHGVQFFLKSKDFGLRDDSGSIGLIGAGTNAVLDRVIPGFNLLLGPETEPRVVIDALRNLTEVNVLSQPSVVVRDNSQAVLQIGDEVPITTRTSKSNDDLSAPIVNSISFRDTGVILKVKPRISSNGVISLDIKQEISSVVDNAAANTLTPTISQRKVESALSVVSGQTVLLGGLISQRTTAGSSGLPVLGDINRWGDLFGAKSRKADRTELILLIRPRIIANEVDASSVASEMRSRLQLLNVNRPPTAMRVPAKSFIK
ncbi:type II secretion system protein GspD [Zhengella mangrovi]|uniref:Type II secretion system protein GspD n=1 Tax=Zhengella mangrovi TaxID=1982044 RepID=A0A2G1QJG2_9HYPH|nr:type II secretion system secretin GspD [Zhengella mangrovi]PHP65594.1 type II secretion system protein GspD [Zhengella mangrovi]